MKNKSARFSMSDGSADLCHCFLADFLMKWLIEFEWKIELFFKTLRLP